MTLCLGSGLQAPSWVLRADSSVQRCVTTTTRPPRDDEVVGVARHFVTAWKRKSFSRTWRQLYLCLDKSISGNWQRSFFNRQYGTAGFFYGCANHFSPSQSQWHLDFGLFGTRFETGDVSQIKGDATEPAIEPDVQVSVSSYIPDDYIPDADQKMQFYQRLGQMRQTVKNNIGFIAADGFHESLKHIL